VPHEFGDVGRDDGDSIKKESHTSEKVGRRLHGTSGGSPRFPGLFREPLKHL
jgi:hypothetical protein